jgi:hypothetical protein
MLLAAVISGITDVYVRFSGSKFTGFTSQSSVIVRYNGI